MPFCISDLDLRLGASYASPPLHITLCENEPEGCVTVCRWHVPERQAARKRESVDVSNMGAAEVDA